MALYNPGATDWKKTLKTVTQPAAVSTGGQMAGLGGTQQPQARTTTATQPAQQSAVYNAASSPSAAALNPDNVNWGVQANPNQTAPSTGVGQVGAGAGPMAAWSPGKSPGSANWNWSNDNRYGGGYDPDSYQGDPTLYYEDGFTSDPRIKEVHTISGTKDASQYLADYFASNRGNAYVPDDWGSGMTSGMEEIYNTLGTLNIDNVGFYQGLKGSPGMDYATWAAANGIPANGGDNQWGYTMFDNWNNMVANGTIQAAGGGAGPIPDGKAPAPVKPIKNNNNGNGHKNKGNGGNGGNKNNGGGGGNRNNGPHGGSGYGPQGQQGPGGGRPNNGGGNKGGGGNKNNNNGGGNKNNNNKKK